MKYPMWYCNWTRFVQRCMIKYLRKRGWVITFGVEQVGNPDFGFWELDSVGDGILKWVDWG